MKCRLVTAVLACAVLSASCSEDGGGSAAPAPIVRNVQPVAEATVPAVPAVAESDSYESLNSYSFTHTRPERFAEVVSTPVPTTVPTAEPTPIAKPTPVTEPIAEPVPAVEDHYFEVTCPDTRTDAGEVQRYTTLVSDSVAINLYCGDIIPQMVEVACPKNTTRRYHTITYNI